MLGWDNLGEPVSVFAVLTDEARQDAVRLLPSVLAAELTAPRVLAGRHESPFDLTGADFLRYLPEWVVHRRAFRCGLDDAFLLSSANSSLTDPIGDACTSVLTDNRSFPAPERSLTPD